MIRGRCAVQVRTALSLARALQPAGRDPVKLAKAMDENWREIYALADLIAERHISTGRCAAVPEP